MNNHACIATYMDRQNKVRYYPSFAIEVTLVNKKLIKLHSDKRSYALPNGNTPNKGGVDCQL
jgi:hypothetical protein